MSCSVCGEKTYFPLDINEDSVCLQCFVMFEEDEINNNEAVLEALQEELYCG